MALVGYQPAPEGGYTFQRDDGSSAYLYGPEAESLRGWIDQTRPADMREARNWNPALAASFADPTNVPPQAPRSAPDVGPNMSVPPAPAPAMSMAPQGAPIPAPTPVSVPAPRTIGPTRVQSPGDVDSLPILGGGAEAAEQPSRGELLKQGLQQLAISAATKGHYVPGRAAVDPAKLAAEGVAVPVRETVQEQIAETPEEHAARLEHEKVRAAQYEEQISAYKAATAESTAALEEQRAQALTDQEKAQQEIAAGLARKKAIEDEYDRVFAAAQKERDAAASDRVDPNRLFRGDKGTVAAIGSAIAVGLGAFGASLGRSPNYAQQIVTAAIDRDVDAQRDQIARRGQAAQNTITEIQRRYGLSIDEASSFVKEAQLRYAASRAQQWTARIGGAEVQQRAAPFIVDMMAKADKEQAAQAILYKGRKTTESAVVQPQKATAGYYTGPTLKDVSEGVNTVATAEKAFKDSSGKQGKLSARLGAQEATNESALEDLQNFMKNDPGGVVAPDVTGIPRTDARIRLDAAAKAIAGKVVVGSNGSISQDELHGIVKDLTDPRESVRKQSAIRLHEALRTARNAIERQRGNNIEGSSTPTEGAEQ